MVSPPRGPQCSPETSVTTSTSSKSPPWASGCWKEVKKNPTPNLKKGHINKCISIFLKIYHLISDVCLSILLSVTQLHFIPVDLGSPIVHCSVADPFVVIMTAEGVVTMFALKIDTYMGKTHRLALQKPQIPTVSK